MKWQTSFTVLVSSSAFSISTILFRIQLLYHYHANKSKILHFYIFLLYQFISIRYMINMNLFNWLYRIDKIYLRDYELRIKNASFYDCKTDKTLFLKIKSAIGRWIISTFPLQVHSDDSQNFQFILWIVSRDFELRNSREITFRCIRNFCSTPAHPLTYVRER